MPDKKDLEKNFILRQAHFLNTSCDINTTIEILLGYNN